MAKRIAMVADMPTFDWGPNTSLALVFARDMHEESVALAEEAWAAGDGETARGWVKLAADAQAIVDGIIQRRQKLN